MSDPIERQAAIDVVHKIIYGFFDLVDDDSEKPISDKDKLLLEVNKAICKGIKDLVSAHPEPCEDTISRQAAIDAFGLAADIQHAGEKTIRQVLSEVPSAQPEQQWIPCSERLPNPLEWDEKYLVSLAWGGIGVMEYKSTGFHNYGSFNPVPIETVIAWMPLPEPYREEGGE